MDVWRITLAALRRWYILVPLLGLTALAAVNVGESVRPEYQATTTFMYTEGRQATDLPNPYGSLVGANEVVSIVLNSVETQRTLAEAGHTAAYEIQAGSRTAITGILTRADSAENAEDTGAALIEAARADLVTRQNEAGIPEGAQVTLQVLEQPTVVAVVQQGKTRIQAVVGVAGAAISLLVAVLFDDIIGLVRRARVKRHPRHAEAKQSDDQPLPALGPPFPESDGHEHPNRTGRHPEDEALIHTDQWVWPEERRPVPSGRPRRNPYFDPEFTKRSLAKLVAAEDNVRTERADEVPHSDEDASAPQEAARRP